MKPEDVEAFVGVVSDRFASHMAVLALEVALLIAVLIAGLLWLPVSPIKWIAGCWVGACCWLFVDPIGWIRHWLAT